MRVTDIDSRLVYGVGDNIICKLTRESLIRKR